MLVESGRIRNTPSPLPPHFFVPLALLAWGGLVSLSGGCRPEPPSPAVGRLPALEALGTAPGNAIVAQGQLKPAAGILPITAPSGDRVEALQVDVGERVDAGAVLGRLASQKADELELAIAETKLREGRQQLAAEQEVARARLKVATIAREQAELQVAQAREQQRRAAAEGGRFALLQQRITIAQNKLQQLRTAAADPTAGQLVSESSLQEQQLTVDEAVEALQTARDETEAKIEAAQLAVDGAQQEIRTADLAITAAEAAAGLDSLEKQIELSHVQYNAVQLHSLLAATVLSIDIHAGEPTTGMPIMRLASTREMVCLAEVHIAELPRLAIGAPATISSPAFDGTLRGRVQAISPLIGSPTLPDPNPMARVDW